jgi:hypothetical protein
VGTVTGIRDYGSRKNAANSHHTLHHCVSILVETGQLIKQFRAIMDATTAEKERQIASLISVSHNSYELYEL